MSDTVWSFSTKRFRVALTIEQDYGYQYGGDDEDGETQRKLESGEYVVFDSRVAVYMDGVEVGSDSLVGSVYGWRTMTEFWTAHRDTDPMNRNCTIMRAAHGGNMTICHFFPGMVSEAIAEARKFLCDVPRLRCA